MPIVVDIDVELARRKMSVGEFAERVGLTPANVAVLKNGRAKAVRFTHPRGHVPGARVPARRPAGVGPRTTQADVALAQRGTAMIEVRGLTKRYGDVLAVDDLTFDVEPGKVTGFLGPNGAGKSTTMRMMLGLDRPTVGDGAGERPAVRVARRAAARGRRAARPRLDAPRPQRPQPPPGGRPHERHPGSAGSTR